MVMMVTGKPVRWVDHCGGEEEECKQEEVTNNGSPV